MVRVAVAGGKTGIGRHIVEGILATKKHEVVVLSRTAGHKELEAQGARVIAVDYSDHASVVSALQGVHTIISTIFAFDESLATAQIALIDAARETGTVRRFVPSEYVLDSSVSVEIFEAYRPKLRVKEALARSGLEWTIFEAGLLMNYLASPTRGLGHLRPLKLMVDVEACKAEIPGTGDETMMLTTVEDVGAFVAASLELEKWPATSTFAGVVTSYNEVVRIAEKVRGKKFDVVYQSIESLKATVAASDPTKDALAIGFINLKLAVAEGKFARDINLNALLPAVQPTGVEEFLAKWWSKV